jgi:poly-gamma-glutamate capsule biosynthesis protein CapA/YwtB (metallophosphatase superfamily)
MMFTVKRRTRMATKLKYGSLLLKAACAVLVFTVGGTVWAQAPTLTITLTGQSMIRSDIRTTTPSGIPAIASLLKGDVIFTNFEGTVAEPGQPNDRAPLAGAGFLAPPGALDSLKVLGFNLIDLSNNHSNDLNVPGIQNTIKEADRLGLVHAGTGNTIEEAAAPAYLHTPKGTIALVAMASGLIRQGSMATDTTPGVDELRVGAGNVPNEEDAHRILDSIREARKQADLVIVYQHNHVFDKPFGTIFVEALPDRLAPAPWLKKWVHEEIDAGADIVVMHGAPLLHGIEIYHNRPIFYDLGNFIFNAPATMWTLEEPITWESVVPTLVYQGKQLQSITLQPIILNYMGQGDPDVHNPHANNQFIDTRGLPKAATGERAGYILQRVAELSQPFGTKLAVTGDTARVDLKGKRTEPTGKKSN